MSEPNKKMYTYHIINVWDLLILTSSQGPITQVKPQASSFRVCDLLQNIYQNAQPQFITGFVTTFLAMAELLLVVPTHMKSWIINFPPSNIEATAVAKRQAETHAMCKELCQNDRINIIFTVTFNGLLCLVTGEFLKANSPRIFILF